MFHRHISVLLAALAFAGCKIRPTGPRPEDDGAVKRKSSESLEVVRAPDDRAPSGARGLRPTTGRWVVRSEHLLYGVPRCVDDRYNLPPDETGIIPSPISLLVRPGMVIGHCDKLRTPLWVAQRVTRKSFSSGGQSTLAADPELPEFARAAPDYDTARTGYECALMAEGAGQLMSSVMPLRKGVYEGPWTAIRNEGMRVLSDGSLGVREMWVIAGPVFDRGRPRETIGNDVGVPEGFFKVFAWIDRKERLHLRGYIAEQRATDPSITRYLKSIDDIERRTGLDLFPDLGEGAAAPLESPVPAEPWNE